MTYALYFLISLIATTLGAVSGMGGGVIIKPALDLIGQYDAAAIGVLSSITVLAMALVAVRRQAAAKANLRAKIAVPLALGAAGGGIAGERLFAAIAAQSANGRVVVMQNACLALLIVCIFVYMRLRGRVKSLELHGILPAALIGLLLGLLSSFLSIGGGPMNVALILFAFSFDLKTATLCSLTVILFSQAAKLAMVFIDGGFARYDLTMLPVMVASAVLGGLIGSALNKKMGERGVQGVFNGVQAVVLVCCGVNIVRAWGGG